MTQQRLRPLDGITVVSLEHAVAAPFCTRQLADLGVAVVHASGGMDAVNKLYGGDFRVRPAVFLPRHGIRTVPSCRTLYPAAQIDQQHLHRDQACRQYVVARGELRLLVQHEAAALGA